MILICLTMFLMYFWLVRILPMQTENLPIQNKQRIYIGGNHGVDEIFQMVQNISTQIGKQLDFHTIGEAADFSDAPVVILKGGDTLVNGSPVFHNFDIHILLVHRIEDDIPQGYNSFNDYVSAYEKLADNLPKAGSYIYFDEDNVATMIGKKERDDVKSIEYSPIKSQKTPAGFMISHKDSSFEIKTENELFCNQAAAAKALLKRIGVSGEQFYTALKTLY